MPLKSAYDYPKPIPDSERWKQSLEVVVTIPEICQMYNKGYTSVLYHVIADNIAGVQTGDGRWLVSLPSVVAKFGKPPHPADRVGGSPVSKTALQIGEAKQ